MAIWGIISFDLPEISSVIETREQTSEHNCNFSTNLSPKKTYYEQNFGPRFKLKKQRYEDIKISLKGDFPLCDLQGKKEGKNIKCK